MHAFPAAKKTLEESAFSCEGTCTAVGIPAGWACTLMNILVLTPSVPYPPNYGGSVRIYNLLRQLCRQHTIHLVTYCAAGDAGNLQGLASCCRTITPVPARVAGKRWQQLRSVFSARSFQWRANDSRVMQATLDRVVREQQIDLILVEFAQMAGFRFPANVPVVLDEHNVEFDLLARMAERAQTPLRRAYNRMEADKFRREELSACRAAALTLVTSVRDEEILRTQIPGLPLAVITNGVDCPHFSRPEGPRQPDTAVFVGATHYFPNEDGVLFFLREIQGRILQARPQFRLEVVGGSPAPVLLAQRSGSVTVTGYVDDVRPYMWNASVFVVPLRMGGGTRFKVVEAMAAGVPVVSTRLGAEGIPAVDGRDLLLADDPESFARAVLRVLTDPALAAMLAGNGLDFVRRYFDWPVVGANLQDALEQVVPR